MADVDCAIIGGGVIGVAIARKLAMQGRSVIVIEREKHIGSGTSSRNSEVIHAGIYYETGSLKAETCVEGRKALYAYCKEHHVGHLQCGKLVVASDAGQIQQLEAIASNAIANGVDDLLLIESAEARRMEPVDSAPLRASITTT